MENFPQNNQENVHDVPETEAAKKFYDLEARREKWVSKISDPNTPPDEVEAYISILETLEPIYDNLQRRLDAIDKRERGEMAAQAAGVQNVNAADLAGAEARQGAENRTVYVSQDGLVGENPDIRKASGYENWVSHSE